MYRSGLALKMVGKFLLRGSALEQLPELVIGHGRPGKVLIPDLLPPARRV